MNFKNISQLLIIMVFLSNLIFGSCGSCNPADASPVKKKVQEKSTVNTLVTSIPKDGAIDGLVITSCGTCNLGAKGKGCSLSVKIGEGVYSVKGTSIHDHGDAHGKVGFCNAVRVAWAKGKMKKNTFHADSFVLVGD